jgi:hypothetical protein
MDRVGRGEARSPNERISNGLEEPINRSDCRIRVVGIKTGEHHNGVGPMKTYRVSRVYRWSRLLAKVVLSGVGGVLYFLAVTHPTPLALRLMLLAGLALFGWLFYVRLPKMPTEITISEDGWVNFRSRRGTTRVQATDIRSIGRNFGRRTLRVVHAGGQLRMPNRYKKLLDFLFTMKGLNPAIEIQGF